MKQFRLIISSFTIVFSFLLCGTAWTQSLSHEHFNKPPASKLVTPEEYWGFERINSHPAWENYDPRYDSEKIEEAIKEKLLADAALYRFKITVEVDQRHVTLKGDVNTPWQSRLVEKYAGKAFGVKSVQNNLIIKPDSEYYDSRFKRNIIQHFEG